MTSPIGLHPWVEWLPVLSQNLRQETAYAVRPLLNRLIDLRPTEQSDREALGLTARSLLAFGMEPNRSDAWLVAHASDVVCTTYDTDAQASNQLLRKLFEAERLATRGADELPRVVEKIVGLAPIAPDLVRDLYVAAFSYEEVSNEATQIGGSVVIPMRSNRRQDYDGALYVLARDYPKFLAVAPREATEALIAVVQEFRAREERHYRQSPGKAGRFIIHGIEAGVQPDGSSIWDELAHYRHEEALQLLDAFSARIATLAGQSGIRRRRRSLGKNSTEPAVDSRRSASSAREHLEEIVATVIFENRMAAVWRRVLEAASKAPRVFREMLTPLAWAEPLLTNADTSVAAGNFLNSVFHLLDREERELIEFTILNLTPAEGRPAKAVERISARLLGCLPAKFLVTPDSRKLLRELHARDGVPQNRPQHRFEIQWKSSAGPLDEELLAEQGVDVESKSNKILIALVRAAEEFGTTYLNAKPNLEQARAILPTLRELRKELSSSEEFPPPLQATANLALARAAGRIARGAPEICTNDVMSFVVDVLLDASRSDVPNAEDGVSDTINSWSPAPRIEAAEALPELARHSACAKTEISEAIKRLATDAAPTVRMQLFHRLAWLWEVDRDFVWDSLEACAAHETSLAVMHGALHGGLYPLSNIDPGRVARLTASLADKLPTGEHGDELRKDCAAIFVSLDIWDSEPLAVARVTAIAEDPQSHPEEAQYILHQLREMLIEGKTNGSDVRRDNGRRRAIEIVGRLSLRASQQFAALHASILGGVLSEDSKPALDKLRGLAATLDGAGSQLYFAAHSLNLNDRESVERLLRLYDEAGPIIDTLADVGLAPLAHHLLELLELLVPFRQERAFLHIARVVRGARVSNYQYDSLGQGVVLRLVQRYLAEYREVVESSNECRAALLDVLDIFVSAGWPEALQLSYRLDDIYR